MHELLAADKDSMLRSEKLSKKFLERVDELYRACFQRMRSIAVHLSKEPDEHIKNEHDASAPKITSDANLKKPSMGEKKKVWINSSSIFTERFQNVEMEQS